MTPKTSRSWSTVAKQSNNGRQELTLHATSCPTPSPHLGQHETTMPRSKSPSPASFPVPTPKFPTNEPVQAFSQKLALQHASEPPNFIDPFCVEVHMKANECPPHVKQDIGEIMKIVLQEIHVVPDRDYFFDGNFVLCYTVFPYRKTLAQVQRRNLRHELAWTARDMWKPELASALARAPIDLFPRAPPSSSVPSLQVDSSSSSSYLEPQSSSLSSESNSNSSTFQNFLQPAVSHLVSKTKKKRGKGLPSDYRARQNLVQLKHDKALNMLRPWLLDESQQKFYLRGDNVAFIQVKCPRALHAVDDFLERILNDESIEIVHCTAPLSRKRQGQLKGYLLYLKCRTAANVARINEIFNTDFAESGLKCKTARFQKDDLTLSDSSESSI